MKVNVKLGITTKNMLSIQRNRFFDLWCSQRPSASGGKIKIWSFWELRLGRALTSSHLLQETGQFIQMLLFLQKASSKFGFDLSLLHIPESVLSWQAVFWPDEVKTTGSCCTGAGWTWEFREKSCSTGPLHVPQVFLHFRCISVMKGFCGLKIVFLWKFFKKYITLIQ